MYYQFTGQPGHGKTVLAIERVLEMKAKADKLHAENPAKHPYRELYVCNVRDFNHGRVGAIELKPSQLRRWSWHPDDPEPVAIDTRKQPVDEDEDVEVANDRINPAFDNAIILVDEAYEHRMFPRRPPGAPIPHHVWKIAKHRHYGIDFVMICQSPAKQMDDFLHDLIEEHYHVRRRYGLPFVHVKRWDRYERNPDKAEPLTRTRRRYPTEVFKLYTSTKYDTSEKRVPWYYYAFGALVVAAVGGGYWNYTNLRERFTGEPATPAIVDPVQQANGAPATVAPQAGSTTSARVMDVDSYTAQFKPRIPSQPWSAPAYDSIPVKSEPPRLFCMLSSPGVDADGIETINSRCTCLTEQGTRYLLEISTCATVARDGQYEPKLVSVSAQAVQTPADPLEPPPGAYRLVPMGEPAGAVGTSFGRPMVDPSYGTITRPAL